jgi:hypothetical protein
MSEQIMTHIEAILAAFRPPVAQKSTIPEEEAVARSTAPDATMNLLLRFETPRGPRTLVAPAIPLALASEIAEVMAECGHYAEFIDRLTPASVAEHIVRRRSDKARATFALLPAMKQAARP